MYRAQHYFDIESIQLDRIYQWKMKKDNTYRGRFRQWIVIGFRSGWLKSINCAFVSDLCYSDVHGIRDPWLSAHLCNMWVIVSPNVLSVSTLLMYTQLENVQKETTGEIESKYSNLFFYQILFLICLSYSN